MHWVDLFPRDAWIRVLTYWWQIKGGGDKSDIQEAEHERLLSDWLRRSCFQASEWLTYSLALEPLCTGSASCWGAGRRLNPLACSCPCTHHAVAVILPIYPFPILTHNWRQIKSRRGSSQSHFLSDSSICPHFSQLQLCSSSSILPLLPRLLPFQLSKERERKKRNLAWRRSTREEQPCEQ